MTQIIESVARAIYEGRNGGGATPWPQQTKAHREPYLADARAAIQTIQNSAPPKLKVSENSLLFPWWMQGLEI